MSFGYSSSQKRVQMPLRSTILRIGLGENFSDFSVTELAENSSSSSLISMLSRFRPTLTNTASLIRTMTTRSFPPVKPSNGGKPEAHATVSEPLPSVWLLRMENHPDNRLTPNFIQHSVSFPLSPPSESPLPISADQNLRFEVALACFRSYRD